MNTEETHVLSGLTDEERRLSAGDEPMLALEPAPAPPYREEPVVPLQVSIPDNAHEILQQIEHHKCVLAQQFDEGDITAREYREAMDRLTTERERVDWAFKKADLAREMRDTAERASWEKEVSDFMTTGPGARIAASQTQMVAFDNIVRQVTADPSNQNLSDRAQLERAWRLYQQDMSRAGLATDAFETANALGNMGGGVTYADPERFAILDRLAANGDVSGIERELSRMTPEERDAYGY